MSPEAQRIAIAEACGYINVHKFDSFREGKFHKDGTIVGDKDGITKSWIPDYLSDLNAMHEAEKILNTNELQIRYANLLWQRTENGPDARWFIKWKSATRTAAQRAEAFLKTLNLWRDDA